MLTFEGLADMLDQYFAGVNYTAPTWYFGLGFGSDPSGYAVAPARDNTAAKMTLGAENYPVTNNFTDDGSRTALDWSSGAVAIGGNVVSKVTPPILNYTLLVIAPTTDMGFIVSSPVPGSVPPPAVLWTQQPMTRNLEPLPVPGDFFETTETFFILVQ